MAKRVSKLDRLFEQVQALQKEVREFKKQSTAIAERPLPAPVKGAVSTAPDKDEQERIFVNPTITVNGVSYGGWCDVPKKLIPTILWQMDQYEQNRNRIGVFLDHGTKQLGQV